MMYLALVIHKRILVDSGGGLVYLEMTDSRGIARNSLSCDRELRVSEGMTRHACRFLVPGVMLHDRSSGPIVTIIGVLHHGS